MINLITDLYGFLSYTSLSIQVLCWKHSDFNQYKKAATADKEKEKHVKYIQRYSHRKEFRQQQTTMWWFYLIYFIQNLIVQVLDPELEYKRLQHHYTLTFQLFYGQIPYSI
jgi:hypothetical protein